MASKKKSTKSSATKAKKVAKVSRKPARPGGAARAEDGGKRAIELSLLSELPPVTAAERRAFSAQLTEAEAEADGHSTRAVKVLADARAWAPIIAKRLAQPRRSLRYSSRRFVWYLECLGELGRAVAGQRSGQKVRGGAASEREIAIARARYAREGLLEALEMIVEGDDRETARLSQARGSDLRNPEELLSSLEMLANLAEEWLGRSDEGSEVLVESVCLTSDDVAAARSAHEALDAAVHAKTEAGVDRLNDSPDVNRIEGRVLYEMWHVMKAFGAAADRGDAPRLVPGPGTRRHLKAPAPKKPAEETTAPTQETPQETVATEDGDGAISS